MSNLRAGAAGLVFLFSLAAPGKPAPAEEAGERAEALIFAATVDRFVGKQMPVTFQLRGDRAAGIAPLQVTLSEAHYCGAIDISRGRLIGVLRSSTGPSSGTPLLDANRDCQDKLNDVAQRLPAGADALAVVEIVAEWVPWQLRFTIGDAAVSGDRTGLLGAALARAKNSGALESIDTSAIRLATERGASFDLDVAVSFGKGGDALATLTPAGTSSPASSKGREQEPRPSFLEPAAAPPGAGAIAGATFPFAQRVVALFSQDGPLVLEFERQAVEVRALQIMGNSGVLTLRGRATPRAIPESLRLAIELAGGDLKVAEVRAEPELEDCASGLAAVTCRARNAARSAAVGAVAAGMTARYRGQLLRGLVAPPPFSFDLGARRLTLRLTPTRVRSTSVGPVVYGRAELD